MAKGQGPGLAENQTGTEDPARSRTIARTQRNTDERQRTHAEDHTSNHRTQTIPENSQKTGPVQRNRKVPFFLFTPHLWRGGWKKDDAIYDYVNPMHDRALLRACAKRYQFGSMCFDFDLDSHNLTTSALNI